jgi:hypothetical protein
MKMNRKPFTIRHTLEDGEVLEGQFTTKRLSIKDRGRIGVRKSQLAGGMYCVRDEEGRPTGQGIDEHTDWLNSMIAHLEVCLEQKPQWWNLDELADIELVQSVYQEVMDFELSFFRGADRGEGGREPGQVGAGGSGSQPAQTDAGNKPTPVVGKEVQAALDA